MTTIPTEAEIRAECERLGVVPDEISIGDLYATIRIRQWDLYIESRTTHLSWDLCRDDHTVDTSLLSTGTTWRDGLRISRDRIRDEVRATAAAVGLRVDGE